MGRGTRIRVAENEWLSSEESKKHFITRYRDEDDCEVGLYGWRRRCLFLVVTILLLLVFLNLALTLWILKVMEFSSNGLGPLKVLPRGIQLRGEAMVLDNLIASKIRSRKGQPIQIEGSRNISLQAKSPNGRVSSQLSLDENKLDVVSSSFKISDSFGRTLFSADKKEVTVGADSLVVTGEGGAVFQGSLQTSKVKADSGHELRLESPTRSLDISGMFGVNLVSGAGDISAMALGDIKLHSQIGTVHLESPNIFLPKLETSHLSTAKVPTAGASIHATYGNQTLRSTTVVYQVCICQKGRIFLALPEGDCVADSDVCP